MELFIPNLRIITQPTEEPFISGWALRVLSHRCLFSSVGSNFLFSLFSFSTQLMVWLKMGKPSGATNLFIGSLALTSIPPNQNNLEIGLSLIRSQRMPTEIPFQNG